MRIIESFLKSNRCYQKAEQNTRGGLMLHSVGCPQPSAQAFVGSWNNAEKAACVHAFIDANTGDIYQTLPWEYRGWHCGSGAKGSGNDTHIGVEMCEPSCIKYTGGATFTCSNIPAAQEAVRRTYESAVQLFAELCKKFRLDPLADGVILSHEEGHRRGIASNHGDPVHLWNQLKMGYTMDGFRKAVKAAMGSATVPAASSGTRITGTAQATADQMRAYIKAKNPNVAQSVIDMIPLYLSEGAAEGIRGDIAFSQSCLETGNFTFKGSAVTLVIIAFKAYLPTFILTDKLAGVLVNLDLGCVAHICVTRFYDAYYQSAAACILYYLAGVPVCHAVSTAGAWLHDKLMHTVRANCFVPHFYV